MQLIDCQRCLTLMRAVITKLLPAMMVCFVVGLFTSANIAHGSDASEQECNRFSVMVTTTPIPHQSGRALARLDELLREAPKRVDLLIVGDSLAANWPRGQLKRQYPSSVVWNFAIGGASTQTLLWQLKRALTDWKPRSIILIVGTNNLSGEPACAIAAGIEANVDAMHEKWPDARILFMSVPPRGRAFMFKDKERRDLNNRLVSWLIGKSYVKMFDLGDGLITCGLYGNTDASPSADRTGPSLCRYYVGDLKHLTPDAYEMIASRIKAIWP
jgi:hypothetical protein